MTILNYFLYIFIRRYELKESILHDILLTLIPLTCSPESTMYCFPLLMIDELMFVVCTMTLIGNQTLCELCSNKHYRKMMAKKSTHHEAAATADAEPHSEDADGI